jgi:DNA (cytosine-5)-methyltransferase 1
VPSKITDVAAVDLFCGAGGLSHGLASQGIDVRVGLDINPACAYPYAANNSGAFVLRDMATLNAGHLAEYWKGADVRLLAGCAPCQAFSTYTQARRKAEDDRWALVDHFVALTCTAMPDLVTMENVPGLLTHRRFDRCVKRLVRCGYSVSVTVVDSAAYGAPQMRQRLVLLASLLGSLDLISPAKFRAKRKTVRDAIGGLEPLKAGQTSPNDPLHVASRLSPLNLKRIRHSEPGERGRIGQ